MSTRYAASLLGLSLAAAAAGVPSPVAAQQEVKAQWVVSRTPDGQPDLQGNWTNGTLTPMQRPEGQGAVLTPDEVERIEGRVAVLLVQETRLTGSERTGH